MLPEVEIFINEVDSANKEYSSKYDILMNRPKIGGNEYWNACGHRTDLYFTEIESIEDKRSSSIEKAWDILEKSSQVPMVKFIAKRCRSYTEESCKILEILPATFDEILQIAVDEGFCSSFSTFFRIALHNNIISLPGMTPKAVEIVSGGITRGMSAVQLSVFISSLNELIEEIRSENR